MTLGKWPKLSARQARELVDSLAAKVALGTDPQEAKFESRARTDTFEEIKTLFLAAQATQLRPRSYAEIERYLTLHASPCTICRWLRLIVAPWPTC